MSKAPKRGKLRNPPKARRYAFIAIVVALLVIGGSGLVVYGGRILYHTSTSTSSTSISSTNTNSTSSSNSTSASSSSTASEAAFINTACTASTTTSSTSGANGTYALICTNLGLIEVELSSSPTLTATVDNFVSLAQSGFYNDLVWHRIVPGFVIQAGDPNTKNGGGDRSTWGQGTSGSSVPFEDDTSLQNSIGTIAMASTGAGVGGSSQFYINLANNTSLDGDYSVFGHVINGMSVVQALANVPIQTDSSSPEYDQPLTPSSAYIVSVTIQTHP
jgi:dolichyl-diphosphooligosaccharide---protein glycosyltransferase